MSEPQLARIGLPTWREDAVARTVAMYDVEDADGALVKVKRGASDQERYAAVLELLEETYSEAAALLHSSKAAAKTKLAVAIGRLNEVSLDGREFAAITPTTYDWRPTSEVLEEKAKPRGANKSAPKVDDEFVKKVVKATEPKPPAKASTRQAKPRTTKAPAKPAPKPRTTTRKRTTK